MSRRLICVLTNTEGALIISADRGLARSSSGTAMMRDTGIIGMISMKPTKNGGTGLKVTGAGGMIVEVMIIGVMTIMKVTGINKLIIGRKYLYGPLQL